ncbi:hypothetical protein [Deinococcus arcticus]|uniref:Spore coat protein U domain-containing protein n=1 Tax=Deinococcus arcticus TaxID=2136176 RepID=A0A2T3WA28_9DEIO|nr:hypothetical protein [Deinococcus arcticus]PTA68682.1 hypothetical protein C8263_05375 [Deinococcus arcticus]
MMALFRLPAALLPALIGGTLFSVAQATPGSPVPRCEIRVAALIEPYRFPVGAQGQLEVTVACPPGRFAVSLSTPDGPLRGPRAPLTLQSGAATAQALLTDWPADLNVVGRRTFTLKVLVPPGQLNLAGGDYSTLLSVRAEALDPAGDLP